MKTLFRILIILSFLALLFFYTSSTNNEEPLEGPNYSSQIIPNMEKDLQISQEGLPRPEQGLSTFIGKSSEELLKKYGEPSRYDQSSYGYEWWIYNQGSPEFAMFAVDNGTITQVYTNAPNPDVTPYRIGQTLDEIYRMTIIDPEVNAAIDENIYTFTMSEEDMNTRILTKFDQVFAQLYIDSETGMLSGIRFMDNKSLVMHRPYEMTFAGELFSAPNPTSYLLEESSKASAKQLTDLLNMFRLNHGLLPLVDEERLSTVAMQHSEDMYSQNYLSHESPTEGSLKERLKNEGIQYERAEEIIATSYIDSIEAVHGWLNSSVHREIMLNGGFTHIGSGTFINYYTQVFIEKEMPQIKQ
ncbi:hypothetical protein D1B33_02610 [Lysinibacillus yapensis]|uniref:CAP domain-containing protein n=1 Tax=Ureibacillus yapensis TaxID=2304605 RepID=A0A396SDP6_9BACL|nr:CAP domain-containing protein [Lysinibacillus yapensis]RHW39760.1 hypothetical protein D1B33_02610 [Lysinibacillus yapensis]